VARLVRADVLVEKSAHNNEPGRRDWREGDAVDRTSRESTDADPDPVVGGADAIEKRRTSPMSTALASKTRRGAAGP